MRSKRSIYNLITSIGAQLILLVLGFIVPRLTLTHYGSETNGYMSLVTQVYGYIGLLEAGLGAAEVQALYAPVAAGDRHGISGVINSAKRYYRKVAVAYGTAVFLLAVILPFAVKSELSPVQMGVYFALFGLPRVLNFWMTQHTRKLLDDEGKNYVGNLINLVVSVSSTISRIILLQLEVSLITLQVAYTFINIFEVLFYYIYIRKNYRWIDQTADAGPGILKQRNSFFVQQICSLILSCTDVLLLSFFCDLSVTSVYAVYMLIYNALLYLRSTVTSSTSFMLGQIYHEDFDRYQKIHALYETAFLWMVFVLYTTAYILALPFVRLYTANVHDANYLVAEIPLLLTIANCLGCCYMVDNILINVAYRAKQTLWQNIGEAALNLGISLALVKPLGIIGVLIGTCLSALFRVIVATVYTYRDIFHSSMWQGFRLYLTNFAVLGIVIFLRSRMEIVFSSYLQFIIAGFVTVMAVSVLYTVANLITNYPLIRGGVIGAWGRLQRYRNR